MLNYEKISSSHNYRADTMSTMKYTYNAVLSGVCAAAASLFGKLIGLQDGNVSLILKAVCFALMFMCNAAVWTFFVKALQASKSSLPVTLTSTATNYVCSGIMGFVLFGEVTSLVWWTGILLVLIGIVLVNHSQTDNDVSHDMKVD